MKTDRFEMRFTPRLKKLVRRAAAKQEISLADFARRAMEEKAEAVLGLGSYAK